MLTTRNNNKNQFNTQDWWQEQGDLWESEFIHFKPELGWERAKEVLADELKKYGGRVSATLVRLLLLEGAPMPDKLRNHALRAGNAELVKLILYRQPDSLTLSEYKTAIESTNNTEFLLWMLDVLVMGLTTASDLSKLQSITARFTSSVDLMKLALEKTQRTSSSETVIAAIKNENSKNDSVFQTVWESFLLDPEVEDQQKAWSSFINIAIEKNKLAELSRVLTDWTEALPKLESAYDTALESYQTLDGAVNLTVKSLQPDVFQLLLANKFPFPKDGYDRLIKKFNLINNRLEEKLIDAQKEREKINFDDDESSYSEDDCCKMIAASICLLGFIGMVATGVLYLKGELNVAITRHSDDAVDDDERQQHENIGAGLANIIIGSVASVTLISCFIIYFCKVAPMLFAERHAKNDMEILLSRFLDITDMLQAHKIEPSNSELEYITKKMQQCPERISNPLLQIQAAGNNSTDTRDGDECKEYEDTDVGSISEGFFGDRQRAQNYVNATNGNSVSSTVSGPNKYS